MVCSQSVQHEQKPSHVFTITAVYAFFSSVFWGYFFVPYRKPYLGKAQQLQEQRYPFLSVCVVFSRVRTLVWLPVSGIFHVHTDADACNCTLGLFWHHKRVCSESWLWEKNPLPHQGLKPTQVLHLACQSDALPTEQFQSTVKTKTKKTSNAFTITAVYSVQAGQCTEEDEDHDWTEVTWM